MNLRPPNLLSRFKPLNFINRQTNSIMKRRTFIKNTAFTAFAVSTHGLIRFDGNRYRGDCETTTDILGPYYRPGSPIKSNLIIQGQQGTAVELSGMIRHNDCVTPYIKAKVELWHCDNKGIYDNDSDAFRYRGTVYSDEKGFYSFTTILPVPYDVGNGYTRPAHFHLMITAEGYQPLITQLYFVGDSHIKKDPYASSEKARNRILEVQKMNDGSQKIVYDVSMSETLPLESATIDKLTGTYTRIDGKKESVELFNKDGCLWVRNEAFGNRFVYAGNNTFEESGNPSGLSWKLQFELLAGGDVQLTQTLIEENSVAQTVTMLKKSKISN